MIASPATLRAGIYGRESKDKAKSIDDQTAEGRDACDERAWAIVAEYTDGVSASRFGTKIRKGWQRLLSDIDDGALDVVVAWEFSRADRDIATWVQFVDRCRNRGVLVHLTGDGDTLDPRNPSHWHRLITGGLDATMESEKISKRVRRGTDLAAAAGQPHGRVPYGYERVIVGERQTPKGPKPVKEQRRSAEAPIVVEIFERIARSDPLSAIVRDLNKRAVRPPTGGKQWTRNGVRIIARNVAYVGQRRHRSSREGQERTDTRYAGTWAGLVDADVFYRAQAVLDVPDRQKTKPGRARWLLSYIAAAPCGGLVHVANGQQGRADRYVCHEDGCASVGVLAAEEVVSRIICARLARPDARALFTPDDKAARAAKAEAAELRAILETHYDEAAAHRLSAGGLAAMEKRLLPQIEDADRRGRSAGAPGALAELLDAAEFGKERVRPVWDRLSVAARREIVATLIDVAIDKAPQRMSRWATDDERMLVAARQLQVTWKAPRDS